MKLFILSIIILFPKQLNFNSFNSITLKKQPSFTLEERSLLAKVMCHEACHDTVTTVYVGKIILNRVNIGKMGGFKNSIKEVIYQKGQFSGVKSWKKACNKCFSLVDSINRVKLDPRCTHYLCPYDKNWYIKKIVPIVKIGTHVYGYYK